MSKRRASERKLGTHRARKLHAPLVQVVVDERRGDPLEVSVAVLFQLLSTRRVSLPPPPNATNRNRKRIATRALRRRRPRTAGGPARLPPASHARPSPQTRSRRAAQQPTFCKRLAILLCFLFLCVLQCFLCCCSLSARFWRGASKFDEKGASTDHHTPETHHQLCVCFAPPFQQPFCRNRMSSTASSPASGSAPAVASASPPEALGPLMITTSASK